MDDKHFIDVDYKQTRSNGIVAVTRKTLFKFFYSTTYVPRSGKPFTINSIIGPISKYDLENVDVNDVISVTLINPRLDERPFVMWVEKADGQIIYYGIKDRMNQKWEPIDDLNEASYDIREKMLLYSIKNMFSLFFASEIKIDYNTVYSPHVDSTGHNISFDYIRTGGLHRYTFKPTTVHSISKVTYNNNEVDFDADMRFVKNFHVYYCMTNTTLPLLIETFDYEIGDEIPLYNYYVSSSNFVNKWVGVECWTKLTKPKCPSEIQSLVDQIIRSYSYHPISIVLEEKSNHYVVSLKHFCSVPFRVHHSVRDYFAAHTYISRIDESFFIRDISFKNVEQIIDVRSRRFYSFTAFFTLKKKFQPVLFCFLLHRTKEDDDIKYLWYKLESLDGSLWKRFEFNENPFYSDDKIEQKIRELYDTDIDLSSLNFPRIILFLFGAIIGGLLGINYSARMINLLISMYRRFRRQRI